MAVWRTGGQPFDASGLEFLAGLSLQATVAIENARLFNETREALEQQTATAEVLQVISSSMADPKPVFEKILDSCERLFGTEHLGIVVVRDDGLVHPAAIRGSIVKTMTRTLPMPLEKSATGRAIRERRIEQIRDSDATRRVQRLGARDRRAGRKLLGRLGPDAVGGPWHRLDHGGPPTAEPFTAKDEMLLGRSPTRP